MMKRLSLLMTFLLLNFVWLFGQSIVDYHGRLQAANDGSIHFKGAKSGEVAYPAGASFFWSEASSEWYTAQTVKNLHEQYNMQIVRAAMQIDPNWGGGYRPNPALNKALVETIVQAAINEGIYVIIDWHVEGSAWGDEGIAQTFFAEMAQKYGTYDNVIYELWNEPTQQTWNGDIKPYCQQIINTIRQYDPDNLILCGTQTWSQLVEDAAANPINDPNVGYVLHFYADLHGPGLYNGKQNLGVPIFVTEWGTPGYHDNTDGFRKWMQDNKVPNCSWAVNNKDEALMYFQPWVTNYTGPWAAGDLRDAGTILTGITKNWPGNTFTPVVCNRQTIPGQIQAESYCAMSGIQLETTTDAGGGQNVGYFDAGDWVKYQVHNAVAGNFELTLRVATTAPGKHLIMETPNGNVTVNLPQTSTNTSNWQSWQTVTTNFALPAGDFDLAISSGTGGFNINWFNLSSSCQSTTLANMTISPANAEILVGETLQLTATGYNTCGNTMSISPTWSANAPGGSFTSAVAGTYTVTVSQGAISASTYVTVKDGSNKLANGNFSAGITGWSTYVNSAATASASVVSGELQANISTGGTENWHVQCYQTGVNLVQGNSYQVSFKAKSSVNRTITASLEMSASPYTRYFSKNVNLTNQMQSFSYTFTMTGASNTNARMLFNLGAATGTVTIDDVVLTSSTSQPPAFSVQIQAENYAYMSGIQTESCAEGGLNVGYIDAGDWMSFDGINIPAAGSYLVEYRVASPVGGGTIRLEQNSGNTVLGSVTVGNTGGWQTWTTVSHTVTFAQAGLQSIGISAAAGGWNLNWIKISSTGSASRLADESSALLEPQISIYPNPVSHQLNLDGIANYHRIQILSLDGREMLSESLNAEDSKSISLSHLKTGIYLIRLTKADGVYTSRIIKK